MRVNGTPVQVAVSGRHCGPELHNQGSGIADGASGSAPSVKSDAQRVLDVRDWPDFRRGAASIGAV